MRRVWETLKFRFAGGDSRMSKKTNNEINNIIQSVLQDYALTCGVTPFNGKVIKRKLKEM